MRSLLDARLSPPPPWPGWTPRPRLAAALDRATRGPITLMSAPAGFGKTTALAAWARGQEGVRWVSLTPREASLGGLLELLLASLGVESVETQAWLRGAAPLSSDEAAGALLGASPQGCVLLLDDVHLIQDDEAWALLEAVVEWGRGQLRLLLGGRGLPPLPWARWRARGWLTELGPEVLAFTEAEAGALLAASEVEAPVGELLARTEGWAAGLRLAALATRAGRPLPTGSDRWVAEFLLEEVLSLQTPELRAFLAQTAHLPWLSAPLCDAARGTHDSAALLARAEAAGLFVQALDPEGRRLRYHALFSDFLASRHPLSPEAMGRAARHLAARGEGEAALELALSAGDQASAAAWLLEMAPLMSTGPGLPRLLGWLERLEAPGEALLLERAWASLITGRMGEAAQSLAALPQPGDPKLAGARASMAASLASVFGDGAGALKLAEQALAALPDAPGRWRSAALTASGLGGLVFGDLRRAEGRLKRAAAESRDTGNLPNALMSAGLGGVALARLGHPAEAERCARAVMDEASGLKGHLSAMGGFGAVALGWVLWEQDRLDEAVVALERGVELGGRWQPAGVPDILARGLLGLALVHHARGEGEASQARLGAVEAVAAQLSPGVVALRQRVEGAISGEAWLGPAPKLSALALPQEKVSVVDRLLRTPAGRLSVAPSALSEALIRWRAEAEGEGRVVLEAELTLLSAALAWRTPAPKQALALAERAFTLGDRAGVLRTWTLFGPWLPPLLSALERQRGARPLPPSAAVSRLTRWLGAPPPLTPRERELLQRVAAGCSNRELARELGLSVGTVKRHLSNAYFKLKADSRTEAVALARAAGWIQ